MIKKIGKPFDASRFGQGWRDRHLWTKRFIDADDVLKRDGIRRRKAQIGRYSHETLETVSWTASVRINRRR